MKRLTLCLVLAACVPQNKYDQALKELDQVRAQGAADAKTRKDLEDHIQKLRAALDVAAQQIKQGEQQIADLDAHAKELQKKLDDATALEAQLRKELEKLGKDSDKLLAEKGTLASSLDEAKSRLDELRKAQAAADARAKLYKDLVAKLKKMTDAGQLRVFVREGKIIIALPNDVLFDSGRSDLKPEGQAAIKSLAKVLVTLKDRRFQVAGHTDNVPIHTERFPSNWELSSSRAIEVVKLLVSEGTPVKNISAAGYGEFDPVAPNDKPDSRQKNRRIEITLQPDAAELFASASSADFK